VPKKTKARNPFQGRWLIEQMDQWDVEGESEELRPFVEFERNDAGRFQFACVYGEMDCRLGQRDGKPFVEFSWDGHDEGEHVFGRGWAAVDGDELNGAIFFHLGDESGFVAKRVKEKPKRTRE
jgi:hypothetical protein